MFMEERVHPIPFRTRQLSSPSSMILRILTWESRTTPRHYFQRAVLYRTALCFLPEAHPHRGHPSLSPGPAQALPAVSPPSLGSPPPSSFCFLRLYAPVRSIIGVSFFPLFPFLASLTGLPGRDPGKPPSKAERCPYGDAQLSCRFHKERAGNG